MILYITILSEEKHKHGGQKSELYRMISDCNSKKCLKTDRISDVHIYFT